MTMPEGISRRVAIEPPADANEEARELVAVDHQAVCRDFLPAVERASGEVGPPQLSGGVARGDDDKPRGLVEAAGRIEDGVGQCVIAGRCGVHTTITIENLKPATYNLIWSNINHACREPPACAQLNRRDRAAAGSDLRLPSTNLDTKLA